MNKCSLGLQLSVWIMQVSIFSSVHINRFHCITHGTSRIISHLKTQRTGLVEANLEASKIFYTPNYLYS